VPILRKLAHEVVSASPSSGVNALTGEGLAEALGGAEVVVAVSNSSSFADAAVLARASAHFYDDLVNFTASRPPV
jgi:hypothetical protein